MAHGGKSAQTAETVAVLGAGGTMGFAMARNIAKAGIGVRAWNRSRDKAIDPSLFFKAIEGGALDLPYLRMKGQAIAERDFTPSFRLTLAAKDAGLVRESAHQRGPDLPLLDLIASRLREGANKHGDEDFSATYLTSAPERAA